MQKSAHSRGTGAPKKYLLRDSFVQCEPDGGEKIETKNWREDEKHDVSVKLFLRQKKWCQMVCTRSMYVKRCCRALRVYSVTYIGRSIIIISARRVCFAGDMLARTLPLLQQPEKLFLEMRLLLENPQKSPVMVESHVVILFRMDG